MSDKPLSVKPGAKIRLKAFNPRQGKSSDKPAALVQTAAYLSAISELEYRLYAEGRRSLLIILQGMDASGKDGTVRHVVQGLNPQSCTVAAFKQPTGEELAHDFLWRVHARTPGRGNIGVFNRSHYEDVVTVRVHELVPKKIWQGRYEAIDDFEQLLANSGTRILKFFLHVSKQEQKQRLQARLEDPAKYWKFTQADIQERKYWNDYQRAYDDALTRCNTKVAPWYIVPADRKWYRNLVVSRVIHDTLREMNPKFPTAAPPKLKSALK